MNKYTKRALISFVIISAIIGSIFAQKFTTAQEVTPSCSSEDGNAVVCLNNVTFDSYGHEPVCDAPRSKIGLFVTCGGTVVIKAIGAEEAPVPQNTPVPEYSPIP